MTHPAQGAIAPEIVDLEVLEAWMDDQGLPAGQIADVEPLAGGTQNILVRFTRGGERYVLRRPPKHLRDASNEVLRREARVLGALAGSEVRHPHLIAACPDTDVMGVVFYLMEPIDGFSPANGLAPPYLEDESWRRQLGLEAADAIAELGAVDHEAVGLADFGKPEGFLERQVPRWTAELESFSQKNEGYPGPQIPELDRIAAWLDDNRPTSWTPGIMHGDYHLANVMYAPDEPRLAAIVDWEMCTIGDPLVDIAWLIALYPGDDMPIGPAASLNTLSGFPTPRDLIARYAERSTRDLSAIDWYIVFACFKCGIILEGTHARAFAGKADKGIGDILHAITLALFAKAATYL